MGLWVRARVEGDEILVDVQERVVVRGGIAQGIGADGEVRWEAAVQAARPAGAWYEVARVSFGAPWEALRVPLLEWGRVLAGVQRHLVGLVAAGWGDSVEEVAAWFVDPLAGATCIVPGVYRMVGSYPPLLGFEGLLLRVQAVEGEEVGRGQFLGDALPELEVPRAEWVLALLLAAVPVQE
jgi:hypothetical protein